MGYGKNIQESDYLVMEGEGLGQTWSFKHFDRISQVEHMGVHFTSIH